MGFPGSVPIANGQIQGLLERVPKFGDDPVNVPVPVPEATQPKPRWGRSLVRSSPASATILAGS